MNKIFQLLITLFFSVSSLAHADWEGYLLPDGFAHENSLAKAVETAKGSGKAVIVYYTRTNCPPCSSLQNRLRKEEIGIPYRDGYVFTAVWGTSMRSDERDRYRTQFWVQGAPTWIIFNRHGKYVCTAAGGFTSDEAGTQLHKTVQSLLATSTEGESATPRSCS
ncbi:MAG: thioredoxin fold domain-containing protein [Candidatus Accumulibacter propinquus]|jgi:thioredoxin-related protein|uniref:thioredoxin fold domain-containing protein n=1 Tax=Candidatus Accumulibacter propinquus TaxID=2954380 RepID=UPI002FC34B8B